MNPQLPFLLQQAIQAFQSGHYERADSILKKVIQIDSKNLPAFHIRGLIKASQKQYKEAVEFLSKAARLDPNEASIRYNLAKALMDSGLYIESIPHHKKTIELSPNNPEAWLNYGKTLSYLGAHKEAVAIYEEALSVNPNYAEAFINKGASQKELGNLQEAVLCADHALRINPNLAEAWANKGILLIESKQYEEVIRHLETALRLNSKIEWVRGDLLYTNIKMCKWTHLKNSLEEIIQGIHSQEKVINPFPLLAVIDDPALHKKCAEIYINDKYPFNPLLGPITKHPRKEKIRIGYYSADFYNHATSYLMAELFEMQDRNKFELVAFSFGQSIEDEMRQRLVGSFDQFIELEDKSDLEIAQFSRSLEIDIAVDLKGFTQNARTGIFSYRSAPIQVSYLGYPGTMGSDYIDYIIADQTLIPSESLQYYAEKVAYLPHSYQVNDRQRVISEKQYTRQELGLPISGFVFSCFNNNYKIMPAIFDCWMQILNAVDGSVLWLFEDNSVASHNLKEHAQRAGIDKSRLIFAQRLPLPEHLARQRQADIFLDTFPYNAHTSASDALWAGLPILTMKGKSFASRVASSLLGAVGLEDLVVENEAQYITLAIELAKNPEKLSAIKERLSQNLRSFPLFDSALFAKNIEAIFSSMYERYQADMEPDHIS